MIALPVTLMVRKRSGQVLLGYSNAKFLIGGGTGTSKMFGSSLGNLLSSLQGAGYSADQVDEIYVTHMHTDHIGGLMRDGQPSFANATVRANVREAGHYLSQSRMDAAPADEREDYESAMAIFKPYVAAERFKPFHGATQLIPGVQAIPAPGHTPGHTIYVIGYFAAAAHVAFPGIGKLRAEGDGYAWIPVSYIFGR